MKRLRPMSLLAGPGLMPLLETRDFGAWEQLVGSTLGHHRSRLLPGSPPFAARIRGAQVDELQLLVLQGRGQLQLVREQCGHGVLWLPLQGLSQEIINGQEQLAEPGMGLLFRPGDAMEGLTGEEVCGVSILLPPSLLPVERPASPLLHQGAASRAVIQAGWQLLEAASLQRPGASFAAAALVEAVQSWSAGPSPAGERLAERRRRQTVAEACRWMETRLGERFSVVELSQALEVSVRNLQYSFQAELGCTPMAEAKRRRLRLLQRQLLNPERADRSIAQLMEDCGLLACGVTAADYRQWCGESPRRTRLRSGAD